MTEKTWAEFYDTGLLWLINHTLHVFGWALVFVYEEDGSISRVFPARVKFRGFDTVTEEKGFQKVSAYMAANAQTLAEECK